MGRKRLELYVHIPFCVKKCPYCDFLSFPANDAVQQDYVDALCREIGFYGQRLRPYGVSTVYLGGGTPTWLRESLTRQLMGALRESFFIFPDAEITIECNPGTVTDHKLSAYRELGINRVSIGMQSARDEELKVLGRIHTAEQFLKTFELARRNGFSNINVDIMSGLPGQTVEQFAESLNVAIGLMPEHVSAYSLTIEKGTPYYNSYKFDVVKQHAGVKPDFLPTEDDVYRMTKMTERSLADAGYGHYEISNFALPGYECRHNIGYWERENYLGLGLGASSLLENIRYENIKDVYAYIEQSRYIREGIWQNDDEELPATNMHAGAERVSRKAQIEEFMFLGLRMTKGISREQFAEEFGTQIEAVYPDVMEPLQRDGLLERRAGRIYLTEKGRDLSNYALAKFLF